MLQSRSARRSPSPARRADFRTRSDALSQFGSQADPVLRVSESGDAVVVVLTGELDLYNTPAVREALRRAVGQAPRRLVVNLSDVTFVDSTALGAFVEARSALADGHAFVLAAPGLEVRRALEVSGLDRHFAVHDTVESALS
ncbi:MAG TPA: STAS domain-containing protein [Gaiellaceae bacterium]|nr:STAS domain-containing protein [Gaiellaceae bacterium]